MSYMSLTAAVKPDSGPSERPSIGSVRSCGTNAERRTTELRSIDPADALRQVPVENLCAVPAHDARSGQQLRPQALDVPDAVGGARQVRVLGDRHDLRAR